MMDESTLPTRLFELIATKDFEELSQEEKIYISSHFSEKEYKEVRQFHRSTAKVFREEKSTLPNPSVKRSLEKAFDKKYKQRIDIGEVFDRIINFRIPVYQAVLGSIALIVAIGLYWRSQNDPFNSSGLLAVADTVFIEKEKPARIDTVYLIQKEKYPARDIVDSSPEKSFTTEDTLEHSSKQAFPSEYNIYITDFKNISIPGRTIREDSLPAEFMVGIL